eukprot:1074431-Prymnesium_polylepis.1
MRHQSSSSSISRTYAEPWIDEDSGVSGPETGSPHMLVNKNWFMRGRVSRTDAVGGKFRAAV